MRKLLPTLLTLILPFVAYSKADSLITFEASDTVYIEITPLQEKAFDHVVKKNQTLFSIAQFYGLKVFELFYYNPDLDQKSLSIGTIIKIPMPTKGIVRKRGSKFNINNFVPVCYVVKPKDNLYNIAKNWFRVPIDTLIERNNLPSPGIHIGQTLHIGWMRKTGIPHTYRKFRGQPIDKKNQSLAQKYRQASQVKRERKEHGVAYWQEDGIKSVDLYALHRKAPLNSIIALTNPMNKRTVYAKVIGPIPETVHNQDVIAVISPRVAKLLGAKDQRAYVKLRYLK